MYYICSGIIDFFCFTLTKEEVKKNYVYEIAFTSPTYEEIIEFEEKLDKLEKDIINTIYKEQKEYPYIIRYFGLPNFDQLKVELCAVAKISNNGSTYIFSEDKSFIERYSDNCHEVHNM